MADLVRRRAAVIVTPGSTPAALAAKAATTSIPVIFSVGTDPIEVGLVTSFSHPGGNVTGITSLNSGLAAKRLGLMLELLPNVERVAVLVNPTNRNAESLTRDAQATGSLVGRQVEILAASTAREIDAAFMTLAQKRADALVVSPDPLLDNRRLQLVTLAAHRRLPTIYPSGKTSRSAVSSYGSARDRSPSRHLRPILRLRPPPGNRAAKFEFVFNLQTAKALGLDVPATLLAQADEVIE
jgi:putative ABC transport system substrate-binding protein